MTPFETLVGRAVALPGSDIDTDVIFPARFLLITEKRGLGRYAFQDWRDKPDFPFAWPPPDDAAILLTGANFGCGSSREQAPWALLDLGFRVLIGESFGEIFHANCFKNGMLPIVLPKDELDRLRAAAGVGAALTIDLAAGQIRGPWDAPIAFSIDPARREALLNGWDEISEIRGKFAAAIAGFETAQRAEAPWLWTLNQGDLHG